MPLQKIRLELARCPDFPNGSSLHGYEFIAPLDREARFDADEWKANQALCHVRRFWLGQADETGLLVHGKGRHWAFSYDPNQEADDEPIFRFDRHEFRVGDYVSITEHDGVQRPFRIAAIERAPFVSSADQTF